LQTKENDLNALRGHGGGLQIHAELTDFGQQRLQSL
jgi:hypothetical protein